MKYKYVALLETEDYKTQEEFKIELENQLRYVDDIVAIGVISVPPQEVDN